MVISQQQQQPVVLRRRRVVHLQRYPVTNTDEEGENDEQGGSKLKKRKMFWSIELK